MSRIEGFRDEFAFLSNFHAAPVEWEGEIYRTVEHAFQAAKTFDPEQRERIRLTGSPVIAKRIGRRVTLREDWLEVRDGVMLECLRTKFQNNPVLKQNLQATGDAELVELNRWHDNYWGTCSCARCEQKTGENRLGKLLVKVREELSGLVGPMDDE